MKKQVLLFLLVIVPTLSAGSLFAQETYYVQSLKARIMSSPSFKALVIGEASRGTKLTAIGKDGNWIKVQFYGKNGYVPSILVSSYPPMAKQGFIRAEEYEFREGVRRRASTYTSAAAARGLAQDDRRRIGRDEKTDYESLEKIEKLSMTDDDVRRFMEGGNP